MTDINITFDDQKACLVINGELDEQGAEDLKGQFNQLLQKQLSEVVVDMNGVDHMGSSSIGKILLFYKNFAIAGGDLQVINLADHLFELFTELKLNTLFKISGK